MAIAVIQPLVLILTNLKSEEFLKYVLGEEVMSVIFARIPTDFEAVSYYVSLMKTISQRINVDNVQQIVAEDGGCPLLERCVELYSTEDSLAQTTVLHIILTFMRGKCYSIQRSTCCSRLSSGLTASRVSIYSLVRR